MIKGEVPRVVALLIKGFKLVPRNLIIYYIASSTLFSLLWAIYSPYLKDLGFTALEFGLLGSVMSASAIASAFIAGWLVDKYGAVKIITVSIILSAIGVALIATGIKVLIYISAGIRSFFLWIEAIALDILVSRVVSKDVYHYAYSVLTAMNSLGHAIGGYAGWVPIIMSNLLNMRVFQAYTITIIIISLFIPLTLLALKGVKEVEGGDGKGYEGVIRGLKGVPKHVLKDVTKLSLYEAFIGLGAAISIHNISYYFILKYGVESGELGTLFGTESLIMALLAMFMPKASELLGSPLKAYVVISLQSIPLLLGITFINNYVIASILYIARTVLMNVASPLLTAFTMTLIPSSFRGRAWTLINFSRSVTTALGRGLGGYLLEINLELPLRITTLLYTMSLMYLYIAFRKPSMSS